MNNRLAKPFGVVYMPGGINGAFWGGAGKVLAPLFKQADITAGVSSGAHNMLSTYLDNPHTEDLWVRIMPSLEVFRMMRLLRGGYPANTKYLVEEHLQRCNLNLLPTLHTKLFVGTFDVWAGETSYHQLTPENTPRLMQATIGYPFFAPFVKVNGTLHGDGGIAESPLPFVIEQGVKKIIVLDTYPEGYQMRDHNFLEAMLAFPHPGMTKARKSLRRRGSEYRKAAALAQRPPRGYEILWLSQQERLPTFHRDAHAVHELWRKGELAAMKWLNRIARFIAS